MWGKFFGCTFDGSMVGAGSAVFAVWGYVISHAFNSEVELNPRMLARIIGDTPENVTNAIDYLCAPDPESRTLDEDGRRMIHQSAFLYHVVNHAKYRKIKNEDDRREYNRDAQRKSRAKRSKHSENGNKSLMPIKNVKPLKVDLVRMSNVK